MMTEDELDITYTPENWANITDIDPTATQTEIKDKINELVAHINYQARRSIGVE